MEKIKQYLGIVFMAMCVMMLSYSCSSDDDDDRPTISYYDFLQGNWLGENNNIYVYMTFSGNNITATVYNNSKSTTLNGNFTFDQTRSVLVAKWNNSSTTEEFPVSINYTKTSYFFLTIGKVMYTMKRQSNGSNGYPSGDTTSETDYAPTIMKNCMVKVSASTMYYYLYFDSYGDITKSSRSYVGEITGGSYTKIGKNKGELKFFVKAGASTITHSYIMTFTSSSGGNVKITDSRNGTFAIEEYDDDISAPTNLLGLSFKTGSGSWGYYFKSHYNGQYSCDPIGGDYYSITAKYDRYSDTSARLTVVHQYKENSGKQTYYYDLTFTSSTGGTYIRTDNNQFSAGTAKGTFTLE